MSSLRNQPPTLPWSGRLPAGFARLQPPLMSNVRPHAQIAFENPAQVEVVALIEELDAYQIPLYPSESHHGIDIEALCGPSVLFAVARLENGEAVGCGAAVITPEYVELKRMYTKPSHRGRGVGGRLLSVLEAGALSRGCTKFVLETGCPGVVREKRLCPMRPI